MNRPAGRYDHIIHTTMGALLLWTIGFVGRLSAQVTIGPDIGVEYGLPLTVDRQAGLVNRFGVPGTGISSNVTGRAGVAVSFRNDSDGGYEPLARLGLALSTGRFVSDSYLFREIVDSTTGAERGSTREFEVYTALSMLHLDLLPLRFRWGDRLLLGGGIWGSYRMNAGFFEVERILSPDSVRFDEGTTERTVLSGEDLGAGRLRWGGIVSVALGVSLGERVRLEPELFGRIDAQSLSEGIGLRRSLSAGLGAAILFDPTPARPLPSDTSSLPDIPLPPRQGPSASIDLYALDSAGRIVQETSAGLEATFYRTTMPLVPVIFFDRDAAIVPDRYSRLDVDGADRFSPATLARLDPIAIYRQTLNIVGMRMRRDSALRVKLVGIPGAGEFSSLARTRAENVRDYLSVVWRIDRSRMTVGSGVSDIGTGAGYVGIEGDASLVAKPISVEWIVNRPTFPSIGMSRTIGDGARRWTVTITRGGRELGRYTSEDELLGRPFAGSFHLDQGTTEPLVAEMRVEDSTEGITVARDTLPFRNEMRADGPTTIEREALTTVVLPGMEAHGFDASVRSIVRSIRDCAEIHVSPVSHCSDDSLDRAGMRFRERTARSLLDGLNGTPVSIERLRLDSGPPDELSTLPECSLLSSGALVTVEQSSGHPCR